MKKFLIYTLALVGLGSFVTSCQGEEDDIFGQSSAERLEQAIVDNTELLCSANNGWVMEYFNNTAWEPGYNYIFKFNSDNSVVIAANNEWIGNEYKEELSSFEVITDNGPVLTFNTYNTLFHLFAAPDDIPESEENESGYGHSGDYEFVFMKVSDDNNTITLKGKKWGRTIIMRRLADDVLWSDYLTQLEEQRINMFSSKIPELVLEADGKRFIVTDAASGVLSCYPDGGDPVTETDLISFIAVPNGLRFAEPYRGRDDGFAIENFFFAEDGSLYCTDEGQNATLSIGSVYRVVAESDTKWRFDLKGFAGVYAAAYDKMVADINAYRKGQKIAYMQLSQRTDAEGMKLTIKTARYELNMYLGVENVDGKLQFTDLEEADNNGTIFYRDVEGLREFMQLLCSAPVALTADNYLSASSMTYAEGEDGFVLNVY